MRSTASLWTTRDSGGKERGRYRNRMAKRASGSLRRALLPFVQAIKLAAVAAGCRFGDTEEVPGWLDVA